MGPAIIVGAYYVMSPEVSQARIVELCLISLPIAFMVAAILHANNIRDMAADRAVNKRTLAVIFGIRFARAEFIFLVIGALRRPATFDRRRLSARSNFADADNAARSAAPDPHLQYQPRRSIDAPGARTYRQAARSIRSADRRRLDPVDGSAPAIIRSGELRRTLYVLGVLRCQESAQNSKCIESP